MDLHKLLCYLGLHSWIRYSNPGFEQSRTHDLCGVCGVSKKRDVNR